MGRIETALHAARRNKEAEPRHNRRAVQSIARHSTEHVARSINGAKVGCIETGTRPRALARRQFGHNTVALDQRAKLTYMIGAEQFLDRHDSKVRVAIM